MPYLFVEEPGVIEFHSSLPETGRALLVMIQARYWNNLTIFSDDGTKLRVEPDGELPRFSIWDRILAATIRMRVWEIRLKYHTIGKYELSELKTVIRRMVQEDTDILTQFMGRETILEELDAAATFEEVGRLARKMADDAD